MPKRNQLVPVLRICLRAHSFFFCLQRAVVFVCSALYFLFAARAFVVIACSELEVCW